MPCECHMSTSFIQCSKYLAAWRDSRSAVAPPSKAPKLPLFFFLSRPLWFAPSFPFGCCFMTQNLLEVLTKVLDFEAEQVQTPSKSALVCGQMKIAFNMEAINIFLTIPSSARQSALSPFETCSFLSFQHMPFQQCRHTWHCLALAFSLFMLSLKEVTWNNWLKINKT